MSKATIFNLSKEEDEIFQDVSKVARNFYLQTIDRLSRKFRDLSFDLSSVGSRNPYHSKIYNQLAEVLLLRILILEGKRKEVVCSDESIYKTLINSSDLLEKRSSIHLESSLKSKIKNLLLPYFRFFQTIKQLIIFNKIAKAFKSSNDSHLSDQISLIDVFFTEQQVRIDGFVDRYWGRLGELVSDKQRESFLYLPTIVGVESLKNIGKYLPIKKPNTSFSFLFKENYMKFQDYIWALVLSLRSVCFKITPISVSGVDISPLIKDGLRSGLFNIASITGLLNYRFIFRLKKQEVNVSTLINWYENQVMDRGLIKGLRDFYPESRSKGYQGFFIDDFYNFYVNPSKYEFEAGYVPDEIYLMGEAHKKRVQEFTSELHLKTTSAFRFFIPDSKEFIDGSSNQILVVLPIFRDFSLKIVNLIKVIAKQKPQFNFVIRAHPSTPIEADFDFSNVSFNSQESMQKLISNSKFMISTTSSACVEAVLMGRCVVIIGERGSVLQNPVPIELRDFTFEVRDENELKSIIDKLAKMPTLSRLNFDVSRYLIEPCSGKAEEFLS